MYKIPSYPFSTGAHRHPLVRSPQQLQLESHQQHSPWNKSIKPSPNKVNALPGRTRNGLNETIVHVAGGAGQAGNTENPPDPFSNQKEVSRLQFGKNSDLSHSSFSSTPHAPRRKKPLMISSSPTTKQSGRRGTGSGGRGKGGGGGGGVHLSTHDLMKQHSYLDREFLGSISTPNLANGMDKRLSGVQSLQCGSKDQEMAGAEGEIPVISKDMVVDELEDGEQQGAVAGSQLREAWGEGETKVMCIKPFRRSAGKPAPVGVPRLDLRRLNEPDENMAPIELLKCEDREPTISRSWGLPPSSLHASPPPVGDLVIQDIGEETDMEETAEGKEEEEKEEEEKQEEEKETVTMDTIHFNFVEKKLLSHERGRLVTQSPPLAASHLPPPPSTLLLPPPPPPNAFQTHLTLGVGVSESNICHRIRFEARVLTQSGRDVHRELCGFFFLSDNSLTIYEFRQFGTKSSALPLIQRGVYCHQSGQRGGHPYQVNYIRKGTTLQFVTAEHPSLPDSLKTRPLLVLRVTNVDERAKKELLCKGRNPMECRSIEAYLSQPLSPSEEKENNLLKTLQGMIQLRLRGRASKTLVGLGRHLAKSAQGTRGGIVGQEQVQQALRAFHISLTNEDFAKLWQLACAGWWGSLGPEQGVFVEGGVQALVGEMGEERKSLVRKVYQKLDVARSGQICVSEMKKFFNVSAHPEVLSGTKSVDEVWFGLFGYLQHTTDPSISYADFENYYEGVSIETPSDMQFCSLIRNTWNIT